MIAILQILAFGCAAFAAAFIIIYIINALVNVLFFVLNIMLLVPKAFYSFTIKPLTYKNLRRDSYELYEIDPNTGTTYYHDSNYRY